jgi:hypothetical protein
MNDLAQAVFWLLILAAAVVFMIILPPVPGAVARRRGHPCAEAIAALGWAGFYCPILWIIAYAWALTVPDPDWPEDEPDYHLGIRRQ